MKALRKRTIWILLILFLLPVLAFGVWYGRQVRQQQLDRGLIEAIKKNDTKTAIALLDGGADANAVDKPYEQKTLWSVLKELWNRSKQRQLHTVEEYPSALILAASVYTKGNEIFYPQNNLVLVKALLEHGAAPNTRAMINIAPPLEFQCDHHNLQMVQLLLEHGANVNASQSSFPSPPLITACYSQDTKTIPCLRLLIKYGADVNATNNAKQTALIACVYANLRDSSSTIDYLLQQGAKVSPRDNNGETALDYARANQQSEVIPLLEAALKKEQAEKQVAGTGIK